MSRSLLTTKGNRKLSTVDALRCVAIIRLQSRRVFEFNEYSSGRGGGIEEDEKIKLDDDVGFCSIRFERGRKNEEGE